ncbi:hypothetical protein N7492_003122 [Penicillium capsulatum]|uniref:Zn(2)-C6 fungal-type domain-containing protein n=1 Tax=Penicillium capsulatum TaxID=69766 RepID=A0A9W9IL96_9EURO|nr:hypothetical protein N7492_003122 [Penicillium capsulatum]KAJ6122288.1 hypothetical protein N7512_004753 [Penicillium capsulatum]
MSGTAAYTLERYQLARQLFPNSNETFMTRAELEALAGPAYELRDRGNRRVMRTWIDDEKDEDYDPEEDSRPLKRKRKSRQKSTPSRNKRAKRSHSSTPELSPPNSPDTSDLIKSPATPADFDDVDPWDTYWAIEPSPEDSPTPYRLRNRNKLNNAGKERVITPEFKDANTEGSSNEKAFTSEGCRACQQLQLPCSSVDDPYHYPCQNCRDDHIDCELFPAPKRKRACEGCRSRRRGVHCSYESADYDHNLPCQACLERGFQCLAGPAKPDSIDGSSEDTDIDMEQSTDDDSNASTIHGSDDYNSDVDWE